MPEAFVVIPATLRSSLLIGCVVLPLLIAALSQDR
jgi:hypothetical protein